MQNINPLDGEKRYSIISKNKMGKRLTTKHSASKKGFAHKHNIDPNHGTYYLISI